MSDFAGEGYRPFPPTYEDNQSVAEFSQLTDAALNHKIGEYEAFIGNINTPIRGVGTASRILSHLEFEHRYRSGAYNEVIEAAHEKEAKLAQELGELAVAGA